MGSIFKGTTDEFKDVADAIRDVNGEEGIYQWPEDYVVKLGEIKGTITEYEDNYNDIIDAVKDIIKEEDPDDAEAIDEADVGPEDIVDAISGDGILIDPEEEEYAPSIIDIIEDLKDRLDLYTEDYDVEEIVSDVRGMVPIKTFINNTELNHMPRTNDPNFEQKAEEVRTTKKLAIYICKAIYETGRSIICIPTRYETANEILINNKWVPYRNFNFAILVYDTESGTKFYETSGEIPMRDLVLIGGTKMVRVVLSNVQ